MDLYLKLWKKPPTFRTLTGLSILEFEKLLAELKPVLPARKERHQHRRPRRRKPGGGRTPTLTVAERLLLLLIYYRTYLTQDFLGVLFHIDKGTVSRNIQAIALALTGLFRIPEHKITIGEDEVRAAFLDATEQPINRPTKKQKQSDSGKKKRHTVKHQVVVIRKNKKAEKAKQKVRIASVSKSAKGSVHDKKLYDRSRLLIPKGVPVTGDSGYPGTTMEVPYKKPRKRELTAEQKASNRELSQRRIVVEHGIGKMKIWRIAAEKYRNPRNRHTVMMKNVAGLHNRMFA
jgi:transposase